MHGGVFCFRVFTLVRRTACHHGPAHPIDQSAQATGSSKCPGVPGYAGPTAWVL
jgi:hypothetical protein